MSGISILIPIYNEANNIAPTISEIQLVLSNSEIEYEIIAINDGSDDESLAVLQAIENIRVINHKSNKGYGAALKTGLRNALYRNICITDADGTYPNNSSTLQSFY
jgi:glycosyltransferase involved in cell wall biosynthesis